jgi:lipid A 3-O-deacylase
MEMRNIFRCAVAVFFILIASGIVRAQINPQFQVSAPALSPSDSTPLAPTALQSLGDEAGQSSAPPQSQPSPQSPPPSQTSAAQWPEGAPTTDAYGKPYKHISQVYYHEWSWESGVYAGGGTGLGTSDATQFLVVGLQVGKVLTEDHLPGIFHGNFEFGGEFLPVYELFTRNPQDVNQNVYGVSIKPVILRWNLTSWNKVVPFVQLAGGFLITTSPVPPGHTSAFNFTPQGGWGFNVFTKPGQAVKTEFIFGHISNANLGIRNPGYNSLFLFEIGYEWLHGWRHH